MTDDETSAVLALAKVNVGSDVGASGFIAALAWDLKVHPYISISPRQAEFLWKLVRRYRRHVPEELAEIARLELSHQTGVC
jgi:hypothetical protein